MKNIKCIILAAGIIAATSAIATAQNVSARTGTYRVGKPYVVAGKTYVPHEDLLYRAEGNASWYGADFHGRRTANGEVYNMNAISAAHPTLPLPSYVRVTNLVNLRSIVVRVNDRGPYRNNRVIDVSVQVAKLLNFYDRGIARVRVEYVGRAALDASDDTKLLTQTLRNDTPTPSVPTTSVLRVVAAEVVVQWSAIMSASITE
jgi:rare lipoprotein A